MPVLFANSEDRFSCDEAHIGLSKYWYIEDILFYAPPFIMGGGHIASPLSVHTYVPYVRKMVSGRYLFENIGVLDSYFIHRYIIIKYRSSSIMDKIHQLFSELWPLIFE